MFRFHFLPRLIARLLAEPAFGLGSFAGVRVRLHPSALFTLVIGTVALARGAGALVAPGAPLESAAFAAAVAALVFLSLVAPEIARAAVGHDHVEVTLHLLGAKAEGDDPRTPRAEAHAAAAGFFTNVGIAGAAAGAWRLAANDPRLEAVAAGAAIVAATNVFLIAVQVIPSLPTHGGRMLRSMLWAVNGDRRRATWIAARNGRWFALAMIAAGIATLIAGYGEGLALVAAGWFVGESAHGTAAAARATLVQRYPASASGTAAAPFGPERAGNRQARKPRTASTRIPGTLASAPNEPPVQSGASSTVTSSNAEEVRKPLTGTDQSSASDQFHPA
jgi:hypothetical protein